MEQMTPVLVVTPHPDDAEGGAGGTIARWTKQGRKVVLVVCTNGDKGTSDRNIKPEDLARIRAEEQRQAASEQGNQAVEVKLQGIKTPHIRLFLGRLSTYKHHAKLSLGHRLVAQVGHPQHQRWGTVKRPDDGAIAEQKAGRWPREADEDYTRDDRHSKHSRDDLQGGDAMAIEGVRVHVPVADGCEGFDAEKEGVTEGSGG